MMEEEKRKKKRIDNDVMMIDFKIKVLMVSLLGERVS
jgi:hypothetical protein